MKALSAGILFLALVLPCGTASGADAPGAVPFPEVALEDPAPRSHGWAYAAMIGGAALIGSSFLVTERANDLYDEYLAATDPARIESLYDDTIRHDLIARVTLFGGEALVATGLYLRFIRRPPPPKRSLSWSLEPGRCALSLHF